MIDVKNIVVMAQNDARNKRMAVMPDGFGALETTLYREIYYLCRAFDDGELSSDAARKSKNLFIGEYSEARRKRDIYDEHMARMVMISQRLADAERRGCECCRNLARVFDGRDVCDNQDKALHD